jgi:hypothetical protein
VNWERWISSFIASFQTLNPSENNLPLRNLRSQRITKLFLGLWNGYIINCDYLSLWTEGCNKSESICSGLWISKTV